MGCPGRDGIVHVVGFTMTYASSAYHSKRCESESHSWRGVLDTTLCDKIVGDFREVCGFLRFPPPIKLNTMLYLKYCSRWR